MFHEESHKCTYQDLWIYVVLVHIIMTNVQIAKQLKLAIIIITTTTTTILSFFFFTPRIRY
jgi:hypothetical protein